MATVALLGIDLGKHCFHLHGQDVRGRQVLRKKLNRTRLLPFLAQLPACMIVMESCGGAHWLARQISVHGHRVKLIAPQHVRPFVTGNKNDYLDAEAICEAACRPKTRYVSVKTTEQQLLSTEHRIRESLVRRRTATINQIHGFLLEFGIALPNTLSALAQVPMLLENPDYDLPLRFQQLMLKLLSDIQQLTSEIKSLERALQSRLKQDEMAARLLSIPGIGPVTATAVVANIGDASHFRNSRDFAASIGLVPRQYSTGGGTVLYGISKRGDSYLRRLFVQCARSIMRKVEHRSDPLGAWIRDLLIRKHPNKVACALANKLARMSWAVLRRGTSYNPHYLV